MSDSMDLNFVIEVLLKGAGYLIVKYVLRRKGEIDRDGPAVVKAGITFWVLVGICIGFAIYLMN